MAVVSDLTLVRCLAWVTERPFIDASRRSSTFWLMDSQCYLQFGLMHAIGGSYRLTLHCANSGNQLLPDMNVVTFIHGAYSSSAYHGCVRIAIGAETTIWRCCKKSVDDILNLRENYGEVTITSVFSSDRPITVRLSASEASRSRLPGSEVVHLSTQTDIVWPPRLTSDQESLSHDFTSLLEQKSYSDVQLRCGGRTFPAHRSILAARSEVFAAMFRNRMKESETATVDVTDMDAEALDVLLKYVYSGKLPDLSFDTASGLYAAGDKYHILGLRRACFEWMVRGMTPENCLDLLVLAEAHCDEEFKERVVDYVAQNLELLKREAWFGFNADRPGLANSVYQKCVATKLSKQAYKLHG